MKFKIDENLPAEIAEMLISDGHDAVTVLAQGLGGDIDSRIIDICAQEERALVTLDLDFADVRTYPPEEYVGLVVLRLQKQDKTNVITAFQQVLRFLDLEELLGRLWIVEERRIRIRGEG